MPGRPPWVVAAFAVAGAVYACFVVGLLLAGTESTAGVIVDEWLYNGLTVAGFVITGARAVLVRDDRLAWTILAFALGCNAFAEIYFLVVAPESYPSLADAAWLAFYPLCYAGIVLLVRRRARSVAGMLWLDGLTAAVAAAALGAAVLVEVVLRSAEGSFSAVATNVAYPIGDILLLSAVFGVFSLAAWRLERRWLVLGLGFLATAIADGVYLFEIESYRAGGVLDALWPASALLVALAAWVDARRERSLELEGRPLLVVPVICSLAAIGILVVNHFARINLAAVILSAGTLGLVLLRLAATFRENAQLLALTRAEAITDALTGLGNRRRLVLDLERALADAHARPAILMIFDLDGVKGYNDSFGHTAGDALLARLAAKLATVPGADGGAYRLGGDEFCVVAPIVEGETEGLIHRSCAALSEHGEGFDVSSSFGAVLLPDEATDPSQALGLADERLYAQKRSRRADNDRSMHAFLEGLAQPEPPIESQQEADAVTELATDLGQRLGMTPTEIADLARAGQLHDLGKLAVPDEILGKKGTLDDREWEFIHRHTVVGERILRASPGFRAVAAIVRSTHENWDGGGYPDGLSGEAIPLAARIVHACDAYVAMTSPRPYRPACDAESALGELERCAGTQFDPAVVRVLVAHVREAIEAERAA